MTIKAAWGHNRHRSTGQPWGERRHDDGREAAAGAIVALLLLVSVPALAQTAPEVTAPLRVQAAPIPSITAPTVDDARRDIDRTPGAVDIVPAEEFRGGRAATPKDILDYVPGVFVQTRFGEDSRLSVRGSGLSRNFHLRGLQLLQDGIPLNTADGAGDFEDIDPLTLRYVEVYKGANALQYGSTLPGGAINLVTPTGRDRTPFQSRVEGGSFGYVRGQLSSGMTLGDIDYFLTPTYVHQDGFRAQQSQTAWRFNTNLGYRIAPEAETRFYLAYNNTDQELPSSLTKSAALTNPRSTAAVNVFNNFHRDVESVRIANRTAFLVGEATQLTIGGYYLDKTLYHPIFQVIDNHFSDGGVFARLISETAIGGLKDRWIFGSFVSGGTNADKRFVNVRGSRGRLTFDSDETAVNVQLYGENQLFFLPDVALVAGAQGFYSIRDADDRFLADGDQSSSRTFTGLNPKLGALWDVTPMAQIFGNVSWSTEVPTFTELNPTAGLPGQRLNAQRAITAELGTRGKAGADLGWELAYYRSWIRDELQNFTLPTGGTFTLNADRTIHQGIELGGDVTLVKAVFRQEPAAPDALRLRLAYTFSDFRFDGDPVFGNNQIPGVPRHYIRAELVYQPAPGFTIGPNVEAVPESYFVDNANTLTSPPYLIVGFRVAWMNEHGLSLFADARNLADRNYVSSVGVIPAATGSPATDAQFFPGEGRAFYVGVEYRW
jgi:iron complex outermembrane receptor protein